MTIPAGDPTRQLRALLLTLAGYIDTLPPGVALQDDALSIADDVNSTISQIRKLLYGSAPGAAERWYDAITGDGRGVIALGNDLATLEAIVAGLSGAPLILTSGEVITLGDVLTIATSAGTAFKADASFSGGLWRVAAIALESKGSGLTFSASRPGDLIPVSMDAVPAAASNGQRVFLSTTPAKATLNPSVATDTVQYLVGYLQGADGALAAPPVLFQPSLDFFNA